MPHSPLLQHHTHNPDRRHRRPAFLPSHTWPSDSHIVLHSLLFRRLALSQYWIGVETWCSPEVRQWYWSWVSWKLVFPGPSAAERLISLPHHEGPVVKRAQPRISLLRGPRGTERAKETKGWFFSFIQWSYWRRCVSRLQCATFPSVWGKSSPPPSPAQMPVLLHVVFQGFCACWITRFSKNGSSVNRKANECRLRQGHRQVEDSNWCKCFTVHVYIQSESFLDQLDSIESKHEVTILGGLNEFVVKFFGPQGSKSVSSFPWWHSTVVFSPVGILKQY